MSFAHFKTPLFRLAFAGLIVLTWVLALMPLKNTPDFLVFWDKAQHVLWFALLAITGCLAFPARIKAVLIGLCIIGIAIEPVQAIFTARTADVFDVVADAIGLYLGWKLYSLLPNWLKAHG